MILKRQAQPAYNDIVVTANPRLDAVSDAPNIGIRNEGLFGSRRRPVRRYAQVADGGTCWAWDVILLDVHRRVLLISMEIGMDRIDGDYHVQNRLLS